MAFEAAAVRLTRRYDVDWLRTIAITLLIVFHIVLSFQFWAASIGFPQNGELLDELLPFISLLTVCRIPLLFLISGMGVRFAMERRDWKQLLKETGQSRMNGVGGAFTKLMANDLSIKARWMG